MAKGEGTEREGVQSRQCRLEKRDDALGGVSVAERIAHAAQALLRVRIVQELVGGRDDGGGFRADEAGRARFGRRAK